MCASEVVSCTIDDAKEFLWSKRVEIIGMNWTTQISHGRIEVRLFDGVLTVSQLLQQRSLSGDQQGTGEISKIMTRMKTRNVKDEKSKQRVSVLGQSIEFNRDRSQFFPFSRYIQCMQCSEHELPDKSQIEQYISIL